MVVAKPKINSIMVASEERYEISITQKEFVDYINAWITKEHKLPELEEKE